MENLKWLFPLNQEEAYSAQKEMAERVSLEDSFCKPLKIIGGMDVSNTPFDPDEMIFGASVVLDYPSLTFQEKSLSSMRQEFPYIPGLLGFREAPVLIDCFKKLSTKPDLIFIDGHGVSHPRGLGIASHIGVLLDIPTIGVGKSILVGTPEGTLAEEAGSQIPLKWKGKQLGMVVRTKKRCAPLIIAAGHKICLESAVDLVLSCLKGYKLPEPTKEAHRAANEWRISQKSSNSFIFSSIFQ